jgi:hypothetical protein
MGMARHVSRRGTLRFAPATCRRPLAASPSSPLRVSLSPQLPDIIAYAAAALLLSRQAADG